MDNSAIYVNADAIRRKHIADTSPSPQLTARNRSHRSVLVCLVVLCVLLLTAVIVLCVQIYTNNHQFHINNKNITEERDQLLTNNIKLTEERDELTAKYYNATELYKQLNWKTNLIWTHLRDGWIYQEVRLYLISSELKSWSESRRYCTERGADLIIINNKEEQDFVNHITPGEHIWIGLSDSDVEGTWKWVDGSTLTSNFWEVGQPGNHREENCAVSQPMWYDYPCTSTFKSICEKKIF